MCHFSTGCLGCPKVQAQNRGRGDGQGVKVRLSGNWGPHPLASLCTPALPGLGAKGTWHRPCSLGSDTGSLDCQPVGVSSLAGPPYLRCRGVGVTKLRVGHGERGPGPAGGPAGSCAGTGAVRPRLPGRGLLGAGGEAGEPVSASTRSANFSNPAGECAAAAASILLASQSRASRGLWDRAASQR